MAFPCTAPRSASAHRPRRVAPGLLLALLLLAAGAVKAQPAPKPSQERKLKAAYLVRFAAFVDWPDAAFARPDSPLVIGIAGDDALAAQAERAAAGHRAGSHPLQVRRLDPDDARNDPMATLHILFVAAPRDHAVLLGAARARPVLTVCDRAPGDGPPAGCVIALVPAGERLRVRVDRPGAAASRLRISARLLAVAS